MTHKRAMVIALDENNRPIGVELVESDDGEQTVNDAAEVAEAQTEELADTLSDPDLPITNENIPEAITDLSNLPDDIALPLASDLGEAATVIETDTQEATEDVTNTPTDTPTDTPSNVETIDAIPPPKQPVIKRRHRFGH